MMFIGDCLKQARKENNLTLESVSKELHISINNLQAIENNQFSKTPGGVYTIGFIRSYSEFLNLDSKEIVQKYKNEISLKEIPNPIEPPKPIEIFHFIYYPKIASLLIFSLVSVTFYFFFVDQSNFQSEYAITTTVPENFEPVIEEYEVEMAILELKEKKDNIKIQKNEIEKIIILTNPLNTNTNNQLKYLLNLKLLLFFQVCP